MQTRLHLTTFALAIAPAIFGQAYTIQTIAGGGWNIPGASANLSHVQGVAVDSAGNVFMALSGYSVVVRMDPGGQLSLVAGNGTQGYSGDNGPATLSQLGYPTAIAVDLAGNIYIEDSFRSHSHGVERGDQHRGRRRFGRSTRQWFRPPAPG